MPTIEKRGSGYRITVSAGYDMQGKQIKKRMTWTPLPGMTEKQIQKELERQKVLFEEKVRTGKVGDGNIKFQDFAEQWFTDYAETHLRNLTLKRYRQLTKRVYKELGHMRTDHIQPQHLIKFYNFLGQEDTETDCKRTAKTDIKAILSAQNITYNKLAEMGGIGLRTVKAAVKGESVSDNTANAISKALQIPKSELFKATTTENKKLAAKTIKQYHIFISSVMERAVKWGIITDNPCRRVDPPKVTQKEIECLTDEQAIIFLEKLQEESLENQVIFNILLLTGMRRGELMGLEWSDIDFTNNTITIRRTSQYTPEKGIYTDTTKTEKSKRMIAIPLQLTQLLKDYSLYQMKMQQDIGDKWVYSDRLLTKWNGEPMHPNTPYSVLQKLLVKYDLPKVSLHSLRHTNATIMINNGADIRTVSGRLGHSQTSTTLNIYAHALQTADANAAESISNVLLKKA